MRKAFFLLLLLLLISPLVGGTNYYVSNSGNNAWPGNSTHPWQTVQKVNSEMGGLIQPGDDIYFKRGDIFTDAQLIVSVNGTSDDPTFIGAYGTGGKPLFEGKNIILDSVSNVTLDGIRIENISGNMIIIRENTTYLKIQNMEGYNSSAHSISINGNCSHIVLRNNSIDITHTGGNDVILGSFSYGLIENNTFRNARHSSINLVKHPIVDEYVIIRNNTVISPRRSLDIYMSHVLIEDNIFRYEPKAGVTDAPEQFCGSNDVIMRNNYLLYGSRDFINIRKTYSVNGTQYVEDPTKRFSVYHNTFYTNESMLAPSNFSWKGFVTVNINTAEPENTGNVVNLSVKNNVMSGISEYNTISMFYVWPDEESIHPEDNFFDNNIVYVNQDEDNYCTAFRQGGIANGSSLIFKYDLDEVQSSAWPNNSNLDFDDWVTYTDNVWDNPELLDDFSLNSSSPAIDTGEWLTNTTAVATSDYVNVDNAQYFWPRITIHGETFSGDNIFVGDDTNLEVLEVDYENNILRVNETITYASGETVSLSEYQGDAPDIGAFESDYFAPEEEGVFYVAEDGNDSWNGNVSGGDFNPEGCEDDGDTSDCTNGPWQSMSKVNSMMQSGSFALGDDILFKRGDTFSGELDVRIGGTPSDLMVIGAYGSGERPIIENSGQHGDNNCIVVWWDESGYLHMRDLQLMNTVATNNSLPEGISVGFSNHTNVTISNVYGENLAGSLVYMEKTVGYKIEDCFGNGSGFNIYGDEYNRQSNGKILGCVVVDDPGDAFQIHRADSANTNVDTGPNHLFYNCTAYNSVGDGFDITAGQNVILKECSTWNNSHGGILVGHDVLNVTIEDCFVGGPGTGYVLLGDGSNIIFRNNLVQNLDSPLFSLYPTDGTGWADEDGYLRNAKIYNNDFVYSLGPSSSNRIMGVDMTYFENIDLKNNIFATTDNSDPDRLYRSYSVNIPPPEIFFDNNVWWHGSGSDFHKWSNETEVLNFVDWQGFYPSEKFMDPLFSDPGNNNFTLQEDSPCVDSGIPLTQTIGSGSGSEVTVDDAGYFMDGYGLIEGDEIKVGSDVVRITSVNYDAGIITVNQSVSWVDSDPVGFDYRGSAPDIGTFEYPDVFHPEASGTYYVASNGNDSWKGNVTGGDFNPHGCEDDGDTSDCTNGPWKTLDKVNSSVQTGFFSSGDEIIFNRGDIFSESNTIILSGDIVIGAYGAGDMPVLRVTA